MNRMTLLIDMDDTLVTTLDAWVSILNRDYKLTVRKEDIRDWDIKTAFPTLSARSVYRPLLCGEIWEKIRPLPDSQDVINKLWCEGYNIYVVTASDYRSIKRKAERLFELFPVIDWEHVIIADNKQMLEGDVLIDDAPHNLIGGRYQKILMDAPHNRKISAQTFGMIRVRNWKEIYSVVHML